MSLLSDVGTWPRRVAATTLIGLTLTALWLPVTSIADPGAGLAPVLDITTTTLSFSGGTEELDGSTTIEKTKRGTKSRIDCTILFAKDSDILRPGAQDRLDRLARQLHDQGPGSVAITGYTDDLGSAAHGINLSQRRAQRVADVLRHQLPDNTFPVTVRGKGEAHPAVPNTSEANRRKNRRVVVTLTHPTQKSTTKPAKPIPEPAPTAVISEAPKATPQPTPTPSAAPSTVVGAPPQPTTPPAGPEPRWAWIAGIAAALVAAGAALDLLRRRHRPNRDHEISNMGKSSDTAPPDTTTVKVPAATGVRQGPAPVDGSSQSTATDPAAATPTIGVVTPSPESAAGRDASAVPARHTSKPLAMDMVWKRSELDIDLSEWHSSATTRPRLTLLGPVHVRTHGKALARRRPYYTELLAFLTLRPRGATVEELADTFNLTTARVRTDMKILRDWLGANPRTGRPYLPDARNTQAARQRGTAVYQVEDVLCDWRLFQQLQERATHAPPDQRVTDLNQALNLVSGEPFEQLRPNGWDWTARDRPDDKANLAIATVTKALTATSREAHNI